MATKFKIQAVDRSSQGHTGAWRSGRFWPSAEAKTIELLDQEEDGTSLADSATAAVIKVGRKTFELLKADGNLRILPAGDPVKLARASEELEAAKARAAEAEKENAGLRTQLAEAEKEIAELRAQLAAKAPKAQKTEPAKTEPAKTEPPKAE